MRALILALIPALLVACGDDTVALTSTDGSSTLGPGTSSEGDPTSPTSTSPGTTATTSTTSPGTSVGSDSATDSGTTTTVTTDATSVSGTTTDGTTLDPSAGTSTGEPGTSSSSTTDGTTGGVMGCGMDGPEIDANLVHLGVDPGCGPIEFAGTNNSDSSGPVYALDGCPCGANCLQPDPWTLTLDVPMAWLPGKIPVCPRIVVERQKSKQGCELVGVSIWDAQAEGEPARYHAGSQLGPIAAAEAELQLEQIEAETCDCGNCCNVPTRLDLQFSALGDSTTLAEGQTGSVANNQFLYEIQNFQSHLSGICDDKQHIDWVMRRM